MEKWWIIEGVRSPTYINLEDERGRVRRTVYILYVLVIVALFLMESANILPLGITLLSITFSIVLEVVLRVLGITTRPLMKTDIMFIKNLLKTLNGRLVKWSIPARYVPVVSILDNGVHVIIHYKGAGPIILVFKPLMYYGVISSKPRVDIKWREIYRDKLFYVGIADLTYPHVDVRGVNYRARVKALYLPLMVESNKLLEIINSFDKYVEKTIVERGG